MINPPGFVCPFPLNKQSNRKKLNRASIIQSAKGRHFQNNINVKTDLKPSKKGTPIKKRCLSYQKMEKSSCIRKSEVSRLFLIHCARRSNSNGRLRFSAFCAATLNRPNYFLAFDYLPKHNVSPIQLKKDMQVREIKRRD